MPSARLTGCFILNTGTDGKALNAHRLMAPSTFSVHIALGCPVFLVAWHVFHIIYNIELKHTSYSSRHKRTLLEKMIALLDSLGLDAPCHFVDDAHHASCTIVLPLLRLGYHLFTRVRNNAAAYLPALPPERPRARTPKTVRGQDSVQDPV